MSARSIAWKTTAPDHDFMRNQSREHIVIDGAPRALCGVQPRWAYENSGASGYRCGRCFAIADKRGLRDEDGERIVPITDLMVALEDSLR